MAVRKLPGLRANARHPSDASPAPAAKAKKSPSRKAGPATRAIHAGEEPNPQTGAINVPIHLSSTFWYPERPDGSPSQLIYSRYSNPSVDAVERKLASLEGAGGSLLFASGMGAIMTACMATLSAGDRVAIQGGVYGGTTAYFRDDLARLGIAVTVLPPTPDAPRVPRGTKLLWMESMTNPLLRVADIKQWAGAARDAGALLAVDATFASPVLQRPLEHGADLVMHSGTKYLGGHADLLAGCLSWSHDEAARKDGLGDRIHRVRRNWGPVLDPHAAYLLGRGMKTMPLRMERHCSNSLALAKECETLRPIRAIFHPGLSSHPDHKTAQRMLPNGTGGMLTIDLATLKRAQAFRRNLRLIIPAASVGGVESLACLPVETSHAYSSPAQRRAEGVTDGLVRISVGIEDVADLVDDVRQALRKS